jgi:hypothetical protein
VSRRQTRQKSQAKIATAGGLCARGCESSITQRFALRPQMPPRPLTIIAIFGPKFGLDPDLRRTITRVGGAQYERSSTGRRSG